MTEQLCELYFAFIVPPDESPSLPSALAPGTHRSPAAAANAETLHTTEDAAEAVGRTVTRSLAADMGMMPQNSEASGVGWGWEGRMGLLECRGGKVGVDTTRGSTCNGQTQQDTQCGQRGLESMDGSSPCTGRSACVARSVSVRSGGRHRALMGPWQLDGGTSVGARRRGVRTCFFGGPTACPPVGRAIFAPSIGPFAVLIETTCL